MAGPASAARGELPARPVVRVRPPRVLALLGYPIAETEMADILERLWCEVRADAKALAVTAPSWRFDLAIEEDFVEEIARIHGYEHVPAAPPRSTVPMPRLAEGERDRFDLRHSLAALGYQEVVNYSFVPEEWERDFAANAAPVRLANPIASTMSVMRSSLLGGLVQTLRANLNRGEDRVRVFEIGRTFQGSEADERVQPERIAGLAYGTRWPEQWAQKGERVDFFDAKGDLQALAGGRRLDFAAAPHPACHPGRSAAVSRDGKLVGIVGELHPRLQQKYDLPAAPVVFEVLAQALMEGEFPRFRGISRMPAVRRDISFEIDQETPVGSLLAAVRGRVPALVREVEVFDQYRGKGVEPGKKSLALRIVMQDTDRTLTDSEVEAIIASIREQLDEQFQAKPRT
jgi:phenylalanyl-tRNA synthetase beta chain